MTKSHSTPGRRRRKHQSAKPHPDYPLTAHPSGRWCKKVRGKIWFFGKIDDHQAALEKWLEQKDDLLAGRIPRARRANASSVTLRELVNRFLNTKATLRDAGDLSLWTWHSYSENCGQLVAFFGRDRLVTDIIPEDFEALRAKWAKTYGPARLAAEINRARVVFNYAWKNAMVKTPILFGEGFRRPSNKAMRLHRAQAGAKMYEREELLRMIEAAIQPLRSMILLGVNAGLGNNDVSKLTIGAINLEAGWLNYPRPKTGIMRRCPLWPETVAAIRDWLERRPAPKSAADADLVFLTFRGHGWTDSLKARPLTNEMRKLLDMLKITGHRNFYALRHTFETIAGESKDQIAVDAIMGHDDGTMASEYRERISDARLQAVVDHIHAWLFDVEKPVLTMSSERTA